MVCKYWSAHPQIPKTGGLVVAGGALPPACKLAQNLLCIGMDKDKEKTNQPQPAEIVFEGWFRDEDEIWISDLDIRDRD